MKWTIYNSNLSGDICLTLRGKDYTPLFDKDYRLEIWLISKINDVNIDFKSSTFTTIGKDLSEIEVLFYLKDYKKQIIEECKIVKNKRHLFLESSNEARNELVKYLLDFINNIEDGD